MKTVSSKLLSAVALILAFTFIFAAMPVVKVDALSYSGSSSYASGKYYQRLIAVQLSGVQRADIVAIAKSQEGYMEGYKGQLSGESGGSGNYTEYGDWYGMQDMWCAMFVSWCAHVAGVSSSIIKYHAYTPSGLEWFQNQGRAYKRSTVANGGYTPIAGDIIYFKSPRNSNPTNHIGIVTGYSNGTVYTVEGNTSYALAEDTNGGAVAPKSYSISNTYIVYICKPAYTTGDNTQASTYVNNVDISGTECVSKTNERVTHDITATKGEELSFQGWSIHSNGTTNFQWNINNTSWGDLPEGGVSFRQDVANAYPSYNKNDVNAFGFKISTGGLNVGMNTIDIRGYTKNGGTYNVVRYNIFLYPQPGSTYLTVPKTTVPADEGIEFTAKGAHDYAWVGLFKAGETPGSVKSIFWYEMGKNEITANIPKSEGIKDNDRGALTPGDYVLYLFVDKDYAVDQKVNIKVTAAEGAHSSLDFPNPRNVDVLQGESFFTAGWGLHPSGISSFFYTVDDGSKINFKNVGVREDLYAIETYAPYKDACASGNAFDGDISTANWAPGKHTVKIGAIAKNGYEIKIGTVTVNVKMKLTAKEELGVVIDRSEDVSIIKNITAGATAADLKAMFNETCTIVDANGKTLSSDARVGTGCKARYYNGDAIDDEVVIIITADINGDGISNGKDIIRMKKFLNNGTAIEYKAAADVDGDGVITDSDASAAVDYFG